MFGQISTVRPKTAKQSIQIQNSLAFLIKLGNCFGLIPVSGVSAKSSVQTLKFNWKSAKSLYSYLVILIFGVDFVLCLVDWAQTETLFNDFVKQITCLNTFFILLLYLNLARKWPTFMNKWSQIDNGMTLNYTDKQTFNFRIKLISVVFILAAIIHAIFYITFNVIDLEKNNKQLTIASFLKRLYPELDLIMPDNVFTVFIILYLSFIGNIIIVFNDLFIIILSTALALRFKQISRQLSRHLIINDEFWIKIRADYDRVVRLTKKADKHLSYIVLNSFSVNILWLLVNISNVVGQRQYNVQIFYNIYSFGFLIIRLTMVSLYAAWINDESRVPMTFLNRVPSNTYNNEIRRFILQISFNDVAITGSNMFRVTRGLILSIAGAIVTYELVVIQFRNTLSTK